MEGGKEGGRKGEREGKRYGDGKEREGSAKGEGERSTLAYQIWPSSVKGGR